MDRQVFGTLGSAARRSRGPLIPNGGIVMLNTTTIPGSMTRFSAADNRFIVCAGNSYSIDGTGGSASGLAFSSQSSGSHLGSTVFTSFKTNTGGTTYIGVYYGTGSYYSGTHGHGINIDILPSYQDIVLAKADAFLTSFPANSIVLSYNSDNWGLTRLFTSNYYARAQSTIASGGGSITLTTIANDGVHTHWTRYYTDLAGTTNVYSPISSGSHTHSSYTLSATWLLKAYSVAALSSATQFDISAGQIIFWESLDPPMGWKICDGTEGTPDLRDYFLKFCASTHEGETDGTNQLSLTGTLNSTNASHSHKGSLVGVGEQTLAIYHDTDDWIHDHTVDDSIIQEPPYYGLVPIIKA